ncbi:MAG: RagB/SusD family nutrient uptake outer membrane protein [Dysgonomonas sp.]|nr:RagB/SusD family nutrient uptake outer membrane protein [Dysgonomonas sp.]
MLELDHFDQAVADATINKLCVRAGIQGMVVSDTDASSDTYHDADVDLALWEIRRERCAKLVGSGFRYHDIKRWKNQIRDGMISSIYFRSL